VLEVLVENDQLRSEALLHALGEPVVRVEVLTVSTEPILALGNHEDMPNGSSQNSSQCQQSYSSFSSQQCTRCSHGCHSPRSV
jgi:hypothetical protein